MATMQSLLDRTRLELGDQPKTFRQSWFGDGATNRWELDYAPLDAETVVVLVAGQDVSDACSVEEATGVIVFDSAPGADDEVVVIGVYFRYFTTGELTTLISSAVEEHLLRRTSSSGAALTLANLPAIEEGPLALAATVKALYVLATDASFDIDIMTPDGVNIPRSERYRQLMGMIEARKEQHRQICEALNIGINRVEVFTLRRISRHTGKYIPVFRPQEIDDYSKKERIYLPIPTYGASPIPSPAAQYDLSLIQGDVFSQSFQFDVSLVNRLVTAQARLYPENGTVAATFTVTVDDAETGLITLSLTEDQTRILPLRSYWDMELSDTDGGNSTTVMSGRVFCQREVTRG